MTYCESFHKVQHSVRDSFHKVALLVTVFTNLPGVCEGGVVVCVWCGGGCAVGVDGCVMVGTPLTV